ncbi:MAG TPA: Gfo/Idh/MocA family oxidoreductase [Chitinophagaceae bacterium]|nr:Gfo/Idh/MocA family oxidoreductase [Chitinophagaceae bacterium]
MTPVNTALCSFGMSGWVFHAPFIKINPGFNLYAVWERSKNRAQEKYPGIKTYRTLEDMLADDAIELAIVNTPNYTHFEYATKALQAGKHVVIEKPFTITTDEGQRLIDLAGKQNKILSVYHNRRYDSDYKTIKKVLSQNLLGKIVEAELHFDRYKEELSPKLHKEVPGPGAGSLYDLGSHLIDQALQLFGMPKMLFADIADFRPLSEVTDYFEIIFYYDDKRVRVKSSYIVREPLPGYVFHGMKGSFIKPKTNIQEEALQAGKAPDMPGWGTEPDAEKGLLHTEIDGKEVREYIPSERGNYNEYYDGMYDAIRNGKPVPVSAEDALKVIRIIELAYQSSDSKKVIIL